MPFTLFDVVFILLVVFDSYIFVKSLCTPLNNVECFSSYVSLAVCNKLNVLVGFIRKYLRKSSNFLLAPRNSG